MKKIAAISGPAMGHVGRLARACYALLSHTEVSIDFIYPQRSLYVEKIIDSRVKKLPQRDAGKNILQKSVAFSSSVAECFDDNDYDLIVHDANPLAWLSVMDFPECPRVNITNAFLTHASPEPTLQEFQFNRCCQQLNELRTAKGLKPLQSAYELYEADRVLLADPGPIVDFLGDMPEHHIQCGACSWSNEGPIPEELQGRNNVLLMSMGSTGASTFEARFLRQISEFVGSSTLVYAGSKAGDLPPEYDVQYSYNWLPLRDVLAKCSAVISQGGAGSSYQALAAACPVIVLPSHRNHEILGHLIQSLGVGICFSDPAKAASKLEQFGFQTLSQNAAQFAQLTLSEDGPNAIASEISALI